MQRRNVNTFLHAFVEDECILRSFSTCFTEQVVLIKLFVGAIPMLCLCACVLVVLPGECLISFPERR